DRTTECINISGEYNGLIKRIMIHRSVMDYGLASADAAVIAGPLGLDPALITSTGLPLETISNGLRQLVVPLQNNMALRAMQPDLIKLKLLIDRFNVHTVDIFTLDALEDKALLYSRHLSPGSGWWEDPGSGAGALSIANYLLRHGVIHPGACIMQQGRDLDELCTVHVEIKEEDVATDSAWIGGLAVTSICRKLSLDEKEVTIS
ncbi:MAG TPA: PhzF family phenazine biosynthesis protein, partial [Candidatus Krumholzibacterium sp.]|nr:PhzF family phenazine biosynthesis protein [Candidatus Krumholzibacterium sp.]